MPNQAPQIDSTKPDSSTPAPTAPVSPPDTSEFTVRLQPWPDACFEISIRVPKPSKEIVMPRCHCDEPF